MTWGQLTECRPTWFSIDLAYGTHTDCHELAPLPVDVAPPAPLAGLTVAKPLRMPAGFRIEYDFGWLAAWIRMTAGKLSSL
jgi:hypothetical protein